MRYICQVSDGWMLARNEGAGLELVLVNTGYPYPNTPKSNVDMLRDLMIEEKGFDMSVNFYHAMFPYIKNFLSEHIKRNDIMVSMSALFGIIEYHKDEVLTNITSK